jgi:hypothetical protein
MGFWLLGPIWLSQLHTPKVGHTIPATGVVHRSCPDLALYSFFPSTQQLLRSLPANEGPSAMLKGCCAVVPAATAAAATCRRCWYYICKLPACTYSCPRRLPWPLD